MAKIIIDLLNKIDMFTLHWDKSKYFSSFKRFD